MGKMRLQTMIEVAICAAMSMVLDLLPSIKIGTSISISFAMVPVLLVALRGGVLAGMASGLLWGLLQIWTGDAWIATPLQGFIEYVIAFSCVGFAGLFSGTVKRSALKGQKKEMLVWAVAAIFVGGTARYFWHFIAGMVFFKAAAKKAGKAPFLFSLSVNGTAWFFSTLVCSIVMVLILSKAIQLVTSARTEAEQHARKIS